MAWALLAPTPRARAAERVRLQWVRLEGAGGCIDSATLEARVRQRLGSDPFDPHATRSIEGVVRRVDGTLRAEVAVRARPDETDPPLRKLKSEAKDCESLSDAVVLAIALAIDPEAALSPAAADSERPPTAPVTTRRPALAPPAPSPPALAGRAGPSAAAQVGLLPRASLGAGLLVAVAISEYLEVEGQARVFPAVDVAGDPGFEIGLALGALQACARLPRVVGVVVRTCGGASLGLVHATLVSGDRAQPGERAWLAAELGLELGLPLTRSLGLSMGLRGIVPITRYRFVVEGTGGELFQQAAVAGMAHAGLELSFGLP